MNEPRTYRNGSLDERKNLPSASGLERIVLCPGSWEMERYLEPEPQSEAAARGERIHAVLAGEPPSLVSEEEMETYARAEELAKELVASTGLGETKRISETRLWLRDQRTLKPIFSGRFDRLEIAGQRAILFDWKTGRSETASAEGNWQLRSLAALAADHWDLDEVTVAIIQPWGTPPVSVAYYDAGDLGRSMALLKNALRLAEKPTAPRIPGEAQCRYCRGKSICPEVHEQMRSLAVEAEGISIAHYSPERAATLLDQCALAEMVIEHVRAGAKALLTENPDAIPGWQLEPGAVRRTIADPVKAFQALSDVMTGEEFADLCTVKIGEAEKAFAKKRGMSARDAKFEFNGRLRDAIEEKQNAPSLKRVAAQVEAILEHKS